MGLLLLDTRYKRLAIRIILAVVAIGLFVGVLLTLDVSAFGQYFNRLSVGVVVSAFISYGAQNVFRALRYRALLGNRSLPLLNLIFISLYHNGMVRLLPFKLGELTYVVLMQQRHRVSVQAGVTSLLWSRLLELVMILTVGALAILLVGDWPWQNRLILLLAALLGVALSAGILYSPSRLSAGLAWLAARSALIMRVAPAIQRFLDEVAALREPQRLLGGLVWSLGTYGSTFLTSVILLNALGVALPLHEFVIVISLGMFATAFPFNFSGFGLVEWSLAFGLMRYAGLALGEAAAMGLLLNGFQQIAALIWGVAGFAALQWNSRPVEMLS